MDYKESFYSPGKLLITGEYLVIDGAKALTLPTRKGQWLKIQNNDSQDISWTSYDVENKIWFEGRFNSVDFSIIDSSEKNIAGRLSKILKFANQLDPKSTLQNGWNIRTELEFPTDWGLGSSSTLLCNLAKWLQVDAHKLHFMVSNGSGYDIASGMESHSLVYEVHQQNVKIDFVEFNPIFKSQIYFIHLNQKQKSDAEVEKYSELKKGVDLSLIINDLNKLTEAVLTAKSLESLEVALVEHEQILSHLLQRDTSRESLFQLYKGGITKYLGAWGGDFVMITIKNKSDLEYFKTKGYHTILSFEEMILNTK